MSKIEFAKGGISQPFTFKTFSEGCDNSSELAENIKQTSARLNIAPEEVLKKFNDLFTKNLWTLSQRMNNIEDIEFEDVTIKQLPEPNNQNNEI